MNERFKIYLISGIVIIALVAVLIYKNPTLTGRVVGNGVIYEEKAFSDKVDVTTSKNTTYTWKIKNPGNIKSIKATGSVSSNASAKVYIEKDGKRYLIYNKSN